MGQVCQRHQEFYEDECRYCEPTTAMPLESCDSAHARLTRLPGGGRCERCKYDILPVAFVRPQFKQIPSYAELLGAEIGVETIGPGESKFWMDFINTKYCKADDPESIFGIADVDRRLGRIADNLSANVALLRKLQLRGRVESIPGGNEVLTEVSYADLGWPPGGVTGDGL